MIQNRGIRNPKFPNPFSGLHKALRQALSVHETTEVVPQKEPPKSTKGSWKRNQPRLYPNKKNPKAETRNEIRTILYKVWNKTPNIRIIGEKKKRKEIKSRG